MATCYYCKYYRTADLIGKPDMKGRQWKKCRIKKKEVHSGKKQCEFFDPAQYFYCDKNGQHIQLAICAHKRFNPKNFEGWSKCKRCRQFEKHISALINDYILGKTKVKKPPEEKTGRKLKRRIGKPKIYFKPEKQVLKPEKRVLKRRKKPKPVRKLKRRK